MLFVEGYGRVASGRVIRDDDFKEIRRNVLNFGS
jgi:hypothetical protein